MNKFAMNTALGPMVATVSDTGTLVRLAFANDAADATATQHAAPASPHETAVSVLAGQINEYVAGTRQTFDPPLPLASDAGTEFDRRVWAAASAIPAGQTRTYGQLAESVGSSGAARAVGAALGRNPLLVLVPCHRVVGHDGEPTGYAGGIDIKRRLLEIESRYGQPAAATLFR